MGIKYKKCDICKVMWNVSIKVDLDKSYICPHCGSKGLKFTTEPIVVKPVLIVPVVTVVKPMRKSEGRVSNVLQRNRNKFSINN